MIESHYWKTELLRAATKIKESQPLRRYSEKQACIFERRIMVSMFCVRTLIERGKISDELIAKKLTIEAYPKKPSKLTTRLNSHRVDELFAMDNPTTRTLKLKSLCNQIIHSYIIFPVCNRQRFTDLLVCSDYERNRYLYLVKVGMIVSLLREVGRDYPNACELVFDPDPKVNDYVVRSYYSKA